MAHSLFSPFKLKSIHLRNRIAVPPMCQYSAVNGEAGEWHVAHYGGLGQGGAGLVIVEATGVAPEGRITPQCLGIWNDEQAEKLKPIVSLIKAQGAVPGIQIAHAGRKASADIPWKGGGHFAENDPRAWEIIAPSAVAFGSTLPKVPKQMTLDDIERVKSDFVAAAKRALHAGFQWLELHFAHGYLAQSFFSVHSNLRTDQYGGSAENRGRFLTETLSAVREVWPEHLPLTARLGVIEFDGRDEETLQESIDLTKEFRRRGLDLLSVSIGFCTPKAQIPWAPAFLAPFAERIKREADIPVSSAWGFDNPKIANQAVAQNQLDLVMVGKAHLANPHWSYKVAVELNQENPSSVLPPQYAHWLERYKLN